MWWLIGIGILCTGYGFVLLSARAKESQSTTVKVVVPLSQPRSLRRQMKALIKAIRFRNKAEAKPTQTDKTISDSTIKRIQEEGTQYLDKTVDVETEGRQCRPSAPNQASTDSRTTEVDS